MEPYLEHGAVLMTSPIGVVYTARGSNTGSGPPDWKARFPRFVKSYLQHPAGIDHHLYIFHKDYATKEDLMWGIEQFMPLEQTNLVNHSDSKSTAGCPDLRDEIVEPIICPLNSSSEIMHDDWLKKLYGVFSKPQVGLVGCTGSRNANLHVRDTAFLSSTVTYFTIAKQFDWEHPSRSGPLEFEHGPNNFTQQILRMGMKVFVVEKDRVIAPEEWPSPTTYHGNEVNVLVLDRGARDYRDFI